MLLVEVAGCAQPPRPAAFILTEISLKRLFSQIRRQHRQPRSRHPPLLQQPDNTCPVGSRPRTLNSPRRKTPRVSLLVNPLDRPVNPPKTKRLLHRLLVSNTPLPGALFIVNQPDLLALSIVLLQPLAPLLLSRYQKSFANLHPFLPSCSLSVGFSCACLARNLQPAQFLWLW